MLIKSQLEVRLHTGRSVHFHPSRCARPSFGFFEGLVPRLVRRYPSYNQRQVPYWQVWLAQEAFGELAHSEFEPFFTVRMDTYLRSRRSRISILTIATGSSSWALNSWVTWRTLPTTTNKNG